MSKKNIMERKYEIVIESTCDLNAELREKYGVYKDYIRGFIYMPGGEEIKADAEWENYSPKKFFSIVRKKVGDVKTAFANYAEFSRVIEPILKEGKDAIIVTISSGISGTANAFRNFTDIILEDYPERKIAVIDSLKYASGSGLLAIYGAKNKDKGLSFEDNVKWLNENRFRLHEMGPMDDLRFLAKNGRIAAGKAFFGQLAGVQPVADFTIDGKNMPLGTVRGDKAVNKFCLEYVKQTIENPEDQIIVICHSEREERAKLFKKQLEKEIKAKEILIIHVSESCGPNIGPGLCVYFYLGKALTKQREFENQLYASIKETL